MEAGHGSVKTLTGAAVMDVNEAAQYLSVSVRTIHNLVSKGELKPARIRGIRALRFRREALDALIETAEHGK
jgi:excisionase family DNA binding protein